MRPSYRGFETFLVHFIVPLLAASLAGWTFTRIAGDGPIALLVAVFAFWATLVPIRRWWIKRRFG